MKLNRQLYIVGNWKEYPETLKDAQKIAIGLSKKAVPKGVTTVVCPPHPFLSVVGEKIKKGKYILGSQDLSPMVVGAYTGEVSPKALVSLGVQYAIIGHSERRTMGETDQIISEKLRAAVALKITPILCVGEKSRQNTEASHTEVRTQLMTALSVLSKKDVHTVLIAYEPLWAIGSKAKTPASPEDAREMRIFIQKILVDMFGTSAMKVPILYGGSVVPKNAASYIEISGMQGLLVGRASLEPKTFEGIITAVKTLWQ